MLYKRGDIVSIYNSSRNINQPNKAVIIQADWFNIGQPPSYVVCFLNHNIYPELDFRPLINKDSKNKLNSNYQVMVDQIQAVGNKQIERKIGMLSDVSIKHIAGCIKAILTL